jgi:hypothetical protein
MYEKCFHEWWRYMIHNLHMVWGLIHKQIIESHHMYKVVQILPGQTVTCLHTNRPGHIWTTLYKQFKSNTICLFGSQEFIHLRILKYSAVMHYCVYNHVTQCRMKSSCRYKIILYRHMGCIGLAATNWFTGSMKHSFWHASSPSCGQEIWQSVWKTKAHFYRILSLGHVLTQFKPSKTLDFKFIVSLNALTTIQCTKLSNVWRTENLHSAPRLAWKA